MDISYTEMLALLSLVGLFAAFCLGFPISYTMLFIGLAFGYLGAGKIVFYLLTVQFYQVMSDTVLGAIPFFLFMGYMLERAGLMDRLFRSFQLLFAKLPGSLYGAIIVTGTIFAAATGIVGSSVNLLCIMSEPAMRASKYDIRLGAGSIAAAGTLGILIPPSIMLVVMGPIMGIPVTDMFAAAIMPGLLLAFIYLGYSIGKCIIWPEYGPPLPKEMRATSMIVVMKELIIGAIPLILLIAATLGSILAGIATPTEAAGCGAFGASLMVIGYRKFKWANLLRALRSTLHLSSMILIMICCCNFFGAVFARLGGATWLSNSLLSLNVPPMVMIVLIMILIFLMGWAMEWIPIVLILVPLTLPVVEAMQFDKLWYAMVIAVALQTAWLSPPVALSAYFIKGTIPHWKLTDIYHGMCQFIVCQLIGLALIIIFPSIVTFLPALLKE